MPEPKDGIPSDDENKHQGPAENVNSATLVKNSAGSGAKTPSIPGPPPTEAKYEIENEGDENRELMKNFDRACTSSIELVSNSRLSSIVNAFFLDRLLRD
jgi:hypothetical protein